MYFIQSLRHSCTDWGQLVDRFAKNPISMVLRSMVLKSMVLRKPGQHCQYICPNFHAQISGAQCDSEQAEAALGGVCSSPAGDQAQPVCHCLQVAC